MPFESKLRQAPFRRFVQNELFSPQANEIPNTAASWLPGDDYYTNFHEGDPFLKVPEGYARLPGAGYEALHPDVEGLDPEDYPDIHKLSILADVAPYSREYNTYRQRIGKEAQDNTELEIEYEKILKRVKQTRESVIRMQDRHFTAPVDEISGTVDEVSAGGITLSEYPGRLFQFSSVSTSAADMSARILGENNNMTRSFRPAEPKRPRARGQDRSCIHASMIRPRPFEYSCFSRRASSQGSLRHAAAKAPHAQTGAKPHTQTPSIIRALGSFCYPVLFEEASSKKSLRHSATRHLACARPKPHQCIHDSASPFLIPCCLRRASSHGFLHPARPKMPFRASWKPVFSPC
jgi:hypothetical protein